MGLPHRLLERVHFAVVARPSIVTTSPFACLDCEHEAGPGWFAVEQDRTGAADAVFATQMGTGEPEVLSEEVGQTCGGARLSPGMLSR